MPRLKMRKGEIEEGRTAHGQDRRWEGKKMGSRRTAHDAGLGLKDRRKEGGKNVKTGARLTAHGAWKKTKVGKR